MQKATRQKEPDPTALTFDEFVKSRGADLYDYHYTVRAAVDDCLAEGKTSDIDLTKALSKFTAKEIHPDAREKLTREQERKFKAHEARMAGIKWGRSRVKSMVGLIDDHGLIETPRLSQMQIVTQDPPGTTYARCIAFLTTECDEDAPADVGTWFRKVGWVRWLAWKDTWQPTTETEHETMRAVGFLVLARNTPFGPLGHEMLHWPPDHPDRARDA